jgi:N-acetylneuraminic acid mutarotase
MLQVWSWVVIAAFLSLAFGGCGGGGGGGSPPPPPPTDTAPDAPTIGTAFAGNGQVTISFTPPLDDGGQPITQYTATCGMQSVQGAGSPLVVMGLMNGVQVACTVTATNSVGTSVPSAASNPVVPAANANSWASLPSMSVGRWSVAFGEVNGVLVAAGGYNATSGHVRTVEAYNVATGLWGAPLPDRPDFQTSAAVAVHGGLLFTIGGTDNITYIPYQRTYNPATGLWSVMRASMSGGARSQPAGALLGSQIHVVGGHDASGALGRHESLDPVADVWTSRAALPTPRTSLGVAVVDGVLYAVGGSTGGAPLASVEAYDPGTNTWTPRAPLNIARSDAVVVASRGLVYAIGGENGGALASVEVYNPATNTWTMRASLPQARIDAQGAVVDGRIYVIGGYFGMGVALSAFDVYTP